LLWLKIEDAIKVNSQLKNYATYKNGKWKIDFKNKEAVNLYNKIILKELFNLELDFHKEGLIPTPINRFLFIDNIFKDNPNIKNVLEIGTGSGVISLLIAKYYNCENIYLTDTVDKYVNLAKNNIIKNKNNLKTNYNNLKVINSNGNIINGINELSNLKFDLIISYPPYYKNNSVPSKRGFGGAYASLVELIGGGTWGEEFSCKIIKEGKNILNKNGIITVMMPSKPIERVNLIEKEIINNNLKLKTDKIITGKRIRYIVKGYNEY